MTSKFLLLQRSHTRENPIIIYNNMVSYTEVSVEVINCPTFLILSQYRLYEIAAVCLVGRPFKQRAFGWC